MVAAALLAVAGCAGSGSTPAAHGVTGGSAPPSAPKAKPTHKTYPKGPPLKVSSIAPFSGTTVGVAMPISVVFADPVAPKARKQIEQHLKVTTSTPVTGAWHWFSPRRVDFRTKTFWKSGTKVRLAASLKHVGDGHGRYGRHNITETFTIGSDVRAHVYVRRHKTVVTRNGKVLRTMPSDAGSPQWESWDGTMAVVDKSRTIRMTSCSVGISCDKSSPNYYDISLPWDVRITWSGTFVHYSTGDPSPGHSYGSHGCVHLSYADAEWFYNLVKMGDPVKVTGSPRDKASGDNGYADFDLSWSQWLARSRAGAFTTHS